MTYRGPDDWFRIDDPETITFYRSVPQEVSAAVAEQVQSTEGHAFDEGEAAEPDATEKAKELAEDNDIDLGSIANPSGKNGDITVEDVKAAIEAAAADKQPDPGANQED